MDCPEAKSGEVEVACPPDDSLVEIFSRLPAKPLFRFKCVSKDWCGLIADRLRCRKSPQTLQGFFAGGRVENYGAFIDLSERPVPLVDPCFSFLTKSPEIEKIVLLDSCNGLVLFEHVRVVSDSDCDDEDNQHYDSLGYIVCNPATEEWVPVPSSGGNDSDDEDYGHYDMDTYLIFDPTISPHYQLIQIRLDLILGVEDVCTFSSVTGEWRLRHDRFGGVEHEYHTIVSIGSCRFNSMPHWAQSERQHMTLAVGGEGRPFRTLRWPVNDRGVIVFAGQSQGHLHCLSGCETEGSEMNELSIWVLEDYNAENWVLRDNVSLSQLFKRTRARFFNDWNVVGIHPNRVLVFFADYWNRKLISYDMDKKEVRAICSLHGYRQPIIPYAPYFAKSAVLAKKG